MLKKLVAATTSQGEDFSLLEDTYRNIMQHRSMWLGAVAKQVGGVVETRTLGGRGKQSFTRIPYEEQSRAVQFLLTHAFQPPKELLDPAIVNRFKYQGVADDVMAQQKSLLQSLLSKRRFARLFDAAVLEPDTSYSADQYLKDLQSGLWSELGQKRPKIVPLRRALAARLPGPPEERIDRKEGDGFRPAAVAARPIQRHARFQRKRLPRRRADGPAGPGQTVGQSDSPGGRPPHRGPPAGLPSRIENHPRPPAMTAAGTGRSALAHPAVGRAVLRSDFSIYGVR